MTAVALFALGSVVAAVAKNFSVLLAARTIQGVGGGGIISLTEVLITDLVPLRQRGAWFGFQSLTWAVGSVTGPLMGGSFAQNVTWRWIFWINLPICGIGLILIPMTLHLEKKPGPMLSKLMAFDWVGDFLLAASVTSFLIPVSWGNVMFAWSSPRTLVPLILGIIGLFGFVAFEIYYAKEPLIPMRIFKQRTALVNYVSTLIQGIVIWSIVYYVPLYYEAVKGYTPTIVGVAVFPETSTVTPASVAVGVLISKSGRFRWAIWTGWFLTVLGMGLLINLSQQTSVPAWIFLNLVPGIGLGMLYNSLAFGTQVAVSPKNVGLAAAMYTFLRSFGQAIGVAIGGAIFQNQFRIKLAEIPSFASNATQLARDASSLVQIIKTIPEDSTERNQIVKAYADSLKVLWAVMAGLAFAALVLSAWTEGLTLDVPQASEHGLRVSEAEGGLPSTQKNQP